MSDSLTRVLNILSETNDFPDIGKPLISNGHYASILDIGDPCLAFSTDGVGTKLLIAQELDVFKTVGIDVIAMNANDIVCVGAKPIALVDCLSLEIEDAELLSEIATGLAEGAKQASISIPGGETAIIPEMLRGPIKGKAFDLVGSCVGLVKKNKILSGKELKPGNVLVGFSSSGIHSNGFTLARQVFANAGWPLGKMVAEFGQSLGEELLKPTKMYVDLAMELLEECQPQALFHITGGGFGNLSRLGTNIGYAIDSLPPPLPIFELISQVGHVSPEEMYRTFNMGVGFCAVVSEDQVEKSKKIGDRLGIPAYELGQTTTSKEKLIQIETSEINITIS